ncbi:M56 family metallopeptidase [uncultured Muriicola sp.]|uniref:M56 family metallopeptidase n=1 Tax=uncultured Muriicola sp. TaxID=1583102 RepID=UPI00263329FB|nr:M56 family metallopeptidase [uncultured Muriicola sp.]
METVFVYILKSSGILGIFYAVYLFFLQKETLFKENRRFLLIGIFCALLCPFLTIPVYIEMVPTSFTQIVSNSSSPSVAFQESGLDLWLIATVLYIAGMLFLLGRLGIQVFSLRSVFLHSANKTKRGGLVYIETSRKIAPFSFFHYIVYNPSLYNEVELEAILAHERAHCSQKHSLDILISHLITVVLWINPMSFLYRNTIRQNLEFLADASATTTLPSIKKYQYALLKVSGHALPIPIVNQFYNSLIKKRIVMLQKSQSKKANMLKSALVLPALALFLFSFNTKEIYVPNSASTEVNWLTLDSDKKIEVKITKDTSDAELEKIKQDMTKEGIDFSYTVVRNAKKEIITLDVDMNSKKSEGKEFHGSSSFDNDGDPIDPVTIVFDPEGQLMFMGGDDDMEFGSKSMKTKMKWVMEEDSEITEEMMEKMEDEGIVVIKVTEDEEVTTDEKGNVTKKIKVRKSGDDEDEQRIIVKRIKGGDDDDIKIITKKLVIGDDGEEMELHEGGEHEKHIKVIKSEGGKDKNVFIIKDSDDEEDIEIIEGEGEAFFFLDSEKGEKPLYIIDGKEVNEKKFKSLSPKDIATVNVWKGDKAIEKYGKKAKDGVVEITTKKN